MYKIYIIEIERLYQKIQPLIDLYLQENRYPYSSEQAYHKCLHRSVEKICHQQQCGYDHNDRTDVLIDILADELIVIDEYLKPFIVDVLRSEPIDRITSTIHTGVLLIWISVHT